MATVGGTFRDAGWGLLVLDHLAKPKPDTKGRGAYARGSGAKLAKADATILIEVADQYDATTSGALRAWKTKDRLGHLPTPWLGHTPQLLTITVDTGQLTITPTTIDTTPTSPDTTHRPTKAMAAVCTVLHRTAEDALNARQLTALVTGYKDKIVRDATELLVHEGYLARTTGARGAKLYHLTDAGWHLANPDAPRRPYQPDDFALPPHPDDDDDGDPGPTEPPELWDEPF